MTGGGQHHRRRRRAEGQVGGSITGGGQWDRREQRDRMGQRDRRWAKGQVGSNITGGGQMGAESQEVGRGTGEEQFHRRWAEGQVGAESQEASRGTGGDSGTEEQVGSGLTGGGQRDRWGAAIHNEKLQIDLLEQNTAPCESNSLFAGQPCKGGEATPICRKEKKKTGAS